MQIAATERPEMSGRDPFGAPESEQARAFATYLAYAARYEVHEDSVELHVELSLHPPWVGTTQVRQFAFDDDGELVLRPPVVETPGGRVAHELRWRRAS